MSAIKIAAALLLLAQTPSFEVASVRPSRSDGLSEFQIRGNRVVIAGMSLRNLARRAYLGSDRLQDEVRIVAGPDWVEKDLFDIQATADGDWGFDADGRPQRLMAMLRNLLEERFKLRTHWEPRELTTFDLVQSRADGRIGSALKPSSLDCPVYPQGIPRPAPDPVKWCGVRAAAAGSVVHVTAQGVRMMDLATSLGTFRSVAAPVTDHTGLPGRFDFEIDFTSTASAAPNNSVDAADAPPDLFRMLQDQLGLKLQSTRGAVNVLVIDAAEKPVSE